MTPLLENTKQNGLHDRVQEENCFKVKKNILKTTKTRSYLFSACTWDAAVQEKTELSGHMLQELCLVE